MELTQIRLDTKYYHLRDEMARWLKDHIGEGAWMWNDSKEPEVYRLWYQNEMFGISYYYFREPAHATLFTLRWA